MGAQPSTVRGNWNPAERPRDLEEGSSEDKPAIVQDLEEWAEQQYLSIKPEVVVNEDFRSWFDAVLKGDWEEIEKILINVDFTALLTKIMTIEGITESGDLTMLDVAIMTAQDQLVEKLVDYLPPEPIKELNLSRALSYAARGGRMRMVKALLDKFGHEPTIIHDALFLAVQSAPDQKEILWYLARCLKCTPGLGIMLSLIMLGCTDISLYLVYKYPDSWTFKDPEDICVLKILGVMTPHFRSGDRLNFWENCVYKFIPLCLVDRLSDDSKSTKMALAINRIKIFLWNLATIPAPFIKRIGESKFRHDCLLCLVKLAFTRMKDHIHATKLLEYLLNSRLVVDAASHGAFEIVDLCLGYFPELLWNINFMSELKKEIVEGRHVELFRLVKARTPIPYLDDYYLSKRIDLLNAVTKWPQRCVPNDVPGAAFLLQRELQWFQVASPVGTGSKVKFQLNRKSYWEDFVEQRTDLLKEAGQWMKDQSSSCSVVATVIITIAFAAAFTVPGGNGNSGKLIFPRSILLAAFAIADVIALFSSVVATSMFLAILHSHYTIQDFRFSLPTKMVLGLTFLFLSSVFMLLAFGSALLIGLSEQLKWIYIPITLLAAVLLVLFTLLQLPLYIEMVESTYWPRLYRPLKLWK